MAKVKISQWDVVAANNTEINSININEGCPPSTINNAIREMMSQVKDLQGGYSGDTIPVAAGGTGATTASTARTNLGITGIATQDPASVNFTGGNITGLTNLSTGIFTATGTTTLSGTATSSGTLAVTGGLTLDGATGTSGQVLVSSGSSATPTWGDAFVTGMIMLWSGSTGSIPSGWALCNGSSGTPDLRDRFVVGAGNTYAVNATGGNANATLPSHSHTFSGSTGAAGSHNHYVTASNTSSSAFTSNTQTFTWASAGGLGNSDYRGGATGVRANRALSSDVGDHSHSMSGSTSAAGSSSTNANLPPYYALAYIMKL